MGLNKTAIFLASRFTEFESIRNILNKKISQYPNLQMAAVDLNNGNVSHRPPLKECLGYVKQSEFMILLLGDTYGSLAPECDKSFTHLEYQEAIKDENNTRVLVFGIGDLYQNNKLTYSSDKNLANWQKEVESNHTIGFIEDSLTSEEISEKIFQKLLSAIYEKYFGTLSLEEDSSEDLLGDELDNFIIEGDELRSFKDGFLGEPQLVDDPIETQNTLSAITNPAAVTSVEQRREAQKAIDLGEHSIAITHLKKAIDAKPLDLISNYWLAQLYVATGKKSNAIEALELSTRSANIAAQSNYLFRSAAAYLIAAKALNILDRDEDALTYAKKAVEVAGSFSKAHIGLARQYVIRKDVENAVTHLNKAFRIYPKSIKEANSDPIFQIIREQINRMIFELKDELKEKILDIQTTGQEMGEYTQNLSFETSIKNKSLPSLVSTMRNLIREQYIAVSKQIIKANELNNQMANRDIDDLESPSYLNFKKSKYASVVKWHIRPGDVIKQGDKICEMKFGKSRDAITWKYKGVEAIIILKLAPQNIIRDQSPFLYSFLLESDLTKEFQLQKQIDNLRENKKQLTQDYNETKKEIQEQHLDRRKDLKNSILIYSIIIGLALTTFNYFLGGTIIITGMFLYTTTFLSNYIPVKFTEIEVNRVDNLKNQLRHANSQLLEYEKKLDDFLSEVYDASFRARESLQLFETQVINRHHSIAPFKTLFNAKDGDIIKVFSNQKNSSHINVANKLPDWLNYDGRDCLKIHLYRVTDKDKEFMSLDPFRAYIK